MAITARLAGNAALLEFVAGFREDRGETAEMVAVCESRRVALTPELLAEGLARAPAGSDLISPAGAHQVRFCPLLLVRWYWLTGEAINSACSSQ